MGVRKNFSYNLLLTVSTYVIMLVTYPYVSRVLGVERIGAVNFADSAVNYFLLFSALGIQVLGVREIAACRGDRKKLQEVFSSLMTLYGVFTAVALGVYVVLVETLPALAGHRELLWVGAGKLVFTTFLLEWLFRGLEEFPYIAWRSLFIKLLYTAAIFLCVKSPQDDVLYFGLTVGSVALNALVNLVYARKFVRFSWRSVRWKPYLRPYFSLGAYHILTSMYTTFNVLYLEFACGDVEVGYYTTALKIYTLIMGLYGTYTTVLLPRMSALLADGDQVAFRQWIHQSLMALFTLCFPLMALGIVGAPHWIEILAGPGYEGAVVPMQLIFVLLLVVGLAQILSVQVLMPLKQDKEVLRASLLGCVLGILLNILWVKERGAVGTACVLLAAETAVTLYYAIRVWGTGILPFQTGRFLWKQVLCALPYAAAVWLMAQCTTSAWVIFGGSALFSLLWFWTSNRWLIKNELLIRMEHDVLRKNKS